MSLTWRAFGAGRVGPRKRPSRRVGQSPTLSKARLRRACEGAARGARAPASDRAGMCAQSPTLSKARLRRACCQATGETDPLPTLKLTPS